MKPVLFSAPTTGARSAARPGWRAVALGALAVLLVLVVQRPGTPPLYDGVGFPDEPYRWVEAPAGQKATAPPTAATGQLRVEGDRTSAAMVTSREQGPQVSVFINVDTLTPPKGATAIDVKAEPAAVPEPPAGATPVSNVYRFSAKARGTSTPVTLGDKPALVNLRANEAVKAWVILHHWDAEAKTWKQVPTFQVGTDVYASSLFAFGDYALFRMASGTDVKVEASQPRAVPEGYTIGTAPASPGTDGAPGGQPTEPLALDTDPGVSNNRLWIGLGLAALILGGGLLLARRAARRQADGDGGGGGEADGGGDGPVPD